MKKAGPKQGTQFKPKQSGNPKGRPKGLPNKATREIKAFATEVLTSEAYVASLWYRVRKRTLAPAIEALFYYYAYGKPKERLEVSAERSFVALVSEAAQLTADQAAALLASTVEALPAAAPEDPPPEAPV